VTTIMGVEGETASTNDPIAHLADSVSRELAMNDDDVDAY